MDQNQLHEEERLAEPQPQEEESFRALLDKMFAFKGGKGNYTEDRHKQPMPDIDTIVKRVMKAQEEAAKKK